MLIQSKPRHRAGLLILWDCRATPNVRIAPETGVTASSAAKPTWIAPTPDAVAAALGPSVDPALLRIDIRDDKFAAFLPDGRIAWFPTGDLGAEALEREARVLDLLHRHCSFVAPRMLARGPNWQLRAQVPGDVAPWTRYRQVQNDLAFAGALGSQLGTMIADQHGAVPPAALAGWLPDRPAWPYRLPRIAADLPYVLAEALLSQAIAVIARYEVVCSETVSRVLVHGDLGLHNLVFAPDDTVAGIFDYADAAFADRHHDFRYLLFDSTDDTLLTAAIAAYRAAGGAPIDPQRVALFNAAAAIGFLADRRGTVPDDRPAGRTLAEDLAWARLALSRLT